MKFALLIMSKMRMVLSNPVELLRLANEFWPVFIMDFSGIETFRGPPTILRRFQSPVI